MSDTLDAIAARMADVLDELMAATTHQLHYDTFEGRQRTLAALEQARRVMIDYVRHRNNNRQKEVTNE